MFSLTGLCCCLYLIAATFQIGQALRAHVASSTEHRDIVSPHHTFANNGNSFKVEGVLHFSRPHLKEQHCHVVEDNAKEPVIAIYRQSDISRI